MFDQPQEKVVASLSLMLLDITFEQCPLVCELADFPIVPVCGDNIKMPSIDLKKLVSVLQYRWVTPEMRNEVIAAIKKHRDELNAVLSAFGG